jgi:nifR3 family TIM-barrel protein
MNTIWKELIKPILVLAPMEDVTDTVFRQIIASCTKPDIFYTEFTNVDGLLSEGHDIVSQRLKYSETEHPIIAQLWGIHPNAFYEAAKQIVALGFDGVDINMGCPQKKVTQHGACAALISNQSLAKEIIDATKKGVNGKIPVSVKTRIGYKKISDTWIQFLLEQHLDALIIHGRTAHEMSKVPAHWDEIAKYTGCGTLIIGNGDVKDAKDAMEKCNTYKTDGAMIGRGVFDNPWCFDHTGHNGTKEELFALLKKHVDLFEHTWRNTKNYAILKKYFKIYIRDFTGASELRSQLCTMTPEEIHDTIFSL